MSTLALENEASVAAEIISVVSAGVIVAPPQNLFLEISVPSLGGGHFRLELTDLDDSEIEDGRLVLKARIDTNTLIIVTLLGESATDGFQTNSVTFGFESAKKTATSNFRVVTLRAALSLATQTRLVSPGLKLELWFRLHESLREISEMLKFRQTMYRIMVIERATGKLLSVPPFITGEDMESVSFIYHAITKRHFEWAYDEIKIDYPASKGLAAQLEQYSHERDFEYPDLRHQSLLGVEVLLGDGTTTMKDSYIENLEQTLRELRTDDGHTVTVRVRSRIGLALIQAPHAPRLPEQTWDPELWMLINMDEQLDAALLTRYHDLAASTLDGLTDEEKAAITERPYLDEEAFLD